MCFVYIQLLIPRLIKMFPRECILGEEILVRDTEVGKCSDVISRQGHWVY